MNIMDTEVGVFFPSFHIFANERLHLFKYILILDPNYINFISSVKTKQIMLFPDFCS